MLTSRSASVVLSAALLAGAVCSPARGQEEDLDDSPAVTSLQARKALIELHQQRKADFSSITVAALLGLAVAAGVHAAWRRNARLARAVAAAGLTASSARFLGLLVMYGDVTTSATSTLIVWAFLAASLAFSFRAPRARTHRVRMPWLSVPRRAQPVVSADDADTARARRPEFDGADERFNEAMAHVEGGRIDEAVAALSSSIAVRDTKRARVYLATILGVRGEHKEALSHVDRALATDASYAEGLSEKVRILQAMGRREDAERVRGELRTIRAQRRAGTAPVVIVSSCPACGADVAGATTCGCGLRLDACARCGRQGVALHPYETSLVCMRCRTAEAASHAKKPELIAQAIRPSSAPPWMAAATFSVAVILGAAVSPAYAWWRTSSAERDLRAFAAVVLELAGAADGASPPAVSRLRAERAGLLTRNDFLREHPASLKIALAIHALGRSGELAAEDEVLARFAAGWASRRASEAIAALDAARAGRLSGGLWANYTQIRDDFERELDARRARSSALASERRPPSPAAVKRNWHDLWVPPRAGILFVIEAFHRVTTADVREPLTAGVHEDGSMLAASGVLRVEVERPPEGSRAAFALRFESLPFDVVPGEQHPLGFRPDARLVPRPGSTPSRAYRAEFGAACEFLALYDLSTPGAGPIVTAADLYGGNEIPLKSLPLFAPGIAESWAQDETLLWPYGETSSARGPAVKQIARWDVNEQRRTYLAIGWLLRYQPASRAYVERVVQGWSTGMPWWDFYDDEIFYFRTRFDPNAAPTP